MFEGKEGLRVFKRKGDAEFILKRRDRVGEEQAEVKKVRISDEESAQKMDISMHPDISIAAEPPKEGEEGWIVTGDVEKVRNRFGEALEFPDD